MNPGPGRGVQLPAWTYAAQTCGRSGIRAVALGHDAACEALAWSLAFILLGAWWWPAAPVGLLLWLASWGSLRRAVQALCRTTEAVFVLQHTDPPTQP